MTSKDKKRLDIASHELAGLFIKPIINIITNYTRLSEKEKLRIVFDTIVQKGKLETFESKVSDDCFNWIHIDVISNIMSYGFGVTNKYGNSYYTHCHKCFKFAELLPSQKLSKLFTSKDSSKKYKRCIYNYVTRMNELMADV